MKKESQCKNEKMMQKKRVNAKIERWCESKSKGSLMRYAVTERKK